MLQFQSVSKTFGDEKALDAVSFDLPKKGFLFITGPSGAGKTTLMRLLTREYLPDEGEILFDEESIFSLRRRKLLNHRRKVGIVFQDYKLLPELNVWENIALALEIIGKKEKEIEERVSELLKLIELPSKAELFPSQLSGGEAQRVSIARALASSPELIFADEPTGNLDPAASERILKLLKKINELGTSVMFATHDHGLLDLLKGEERIHLDKGRLIRHSEQAKPKGKRSEESLEKKPQAKSRTKATNKSQRSFANAQDDDGKKKKTRLSLPGFDFFKLKKNKKVDSKIDDRLSNIE